MPEYMPGPPDTYQSYGRPWGNASNTPFREYKKFGHEGGIATPLIAHWPSGIQRAGELERQPGHVVDLMKTFVDLADATYPETYNGNEIRPMQGVSLVPAFHGNDLSREEPLFFEHEGNRALRDGRWKLVANSPSGEWELYDMETDRTETNNLANKQPERLRDMVQKWESMARRFNAIPWPYDGDYGKKRNK
jgi:arylsulfatase